MMLARIKALLSKPKTADYSQFHWRAFTQPRDLPIFSFEIIRNMLIDPTIRLGLAMRAAPLSQVEFGQKQTDGSFLPGVAAHDADVGRFVHRQLQRIWDFHLHKILTAQVWGWSAGEVTYQIKNDKVEVAGLLHRSAVDVLALVRSGEIKGVRFQRIKNLGQVDLFFPKAWWHAYDPEAESPYGVSALLGCYSPWADKWLAGGALDVRRLFMHKDAYGGVDITYPPGTTYVKGEEKPNRDIAREIVEQIIAGGVTTRPSEYDSTGKPLWELTRATVPSSPTHILDYPKHLDVEILRGLEIPDDVLTSEASGAWQGKQVPMQAFYTNAERWLNQVIQCVVTQILEPLVLLNWGRAEDFQVTTKPLSEQIMEQIKGTEQQNQSSQTQQPDPQQRNGFRRMAVRHAPKGGISIGGKRFDGGEFIPSEVLKKATAAERKMLDRPEVTGKSESREKAKPESKEDKFEALLATKSKSDAEAFRKARADGIAIPPAWTEVTYYGKDSDIRAEGRDAKGRKQRAENPEFRQRISDANNARISKELKPRMDKLREQLRAGAAGGDEEAKVLYLISLTGFRIGGSADTKAKTKAFGASTLQGEHVSVDGNTVTFDFPGKKGVRQLHTIEDEVIADMFRDAKDGEKVFSTRDTKVRDAWKSKYGGTKVHDIRHVVATELAEEELSKRIPPPPKTDRERKRLVKEVAEVAAGKLGNNPSQTLGTYIDPAIWEALKVAA